MTRIILPSIYIIVDGRGWVIGNDRVKAPIKAGEGVYREKGEWLESGTDVGIVALVNESDGVEDYYGKVDK